MPSENMPSPFYMDLLNNLKNDEDIKMPDEFFKICSSVEKKCQYYDNKRNFHLFNRLESKFCIFVICL